MWETALNIIIVTSGYKVGEVTNIPLDSGINEQKENLLEKPFEEI